MNSIFRKTQFSEKYLMFNIENNAFYMVWKYSKFYSIFAALLQAFYQLGDDG